MREIKFRAWDKQRRIMIYNVFVENNDNDGFVTFWDDDFSMFEKNYLPFSDVDVMQYTGLKDKNGREIYEFMEINNKYKVEYKPSCYVLTNISNGDIVSFEEVIKNENEITITKEYTEV
jgi:uncharacterized phage protein (TIGR01671 family)